MIMLPSFCTKYCHYHYYYYFVLALIFIVMLFKILNSLSYIFGVSLLWTGLILKISSHLPCKLPWVEIEQIFVFRKTIIMALIGYLGPIGWDCIKLEKSRCCSWYPVMFVSMASFNRTWKVSRNDLRIICFLSLGIIVAVTMYVVIITRQKYVRHVKGRPMSRSHVLFPQISYREANNGIFECIQYLFNYGFYRFGIEVRFCINIGLFIWGVLWKLDRKLKLNFLHSRWTSINLK